MYLFKRFFGPLRTNAILIGCEQTKTAAVIDPSAGSAASLLACGFQIEKILLTHSHWDHFGDAAELKLKTGAPLYVHFLDAKNVEQPGSDGLTMGPSVQAVKVDQFLNEGDLIRVGLLTLEVIHTPGHCPGSVCFYLKEQNLLIAGDTLFRGGIGNLSLPTANAAHMKSSLAKLAKLPAETRVICGHGPDTTIGEELH